MPLTSAEAEILEKLSDNFPYRIHDLPPDEASALKSLLSRDYVERQLCTEGNTIDGFFYLYRITHSGSMALSEHRQQKPDDSAQNRAHRQIGGRRAAFVKALRESLRPVLIATVSGLLVWLITFLLQRFL